jgi:ATP-binding cassette subfamily G (WHITE) protein 2 (PDR)
MGFECPSRQTTGDFLTSLTSPAERVVRSGFEGRTPYTPDEFAAAWERSDDRAQLLREIDEFNQKYPIGGEHLEKFKESRRGMNAFFDAQVFLLIWLCSGASKDSTYKVSIYSLCSHAD